MPHRLHFCLLATEDPRRVQVYRRGVHWLWPTLEFNGRSRLPLVGAHKLTSTIGACTPVCVTYPSVVTPRQLEWLAVFRVASTQRLTDCTWVALDGLDERHAVVPYQSTALCWYRAGRKRTRAAGTFESPGALDRIRGWIAEQLGRERRLLSAVTAYRLSGDEAVLRFEASPRPVYFKAQRIRPFRDALVSQLLARVRPGVTADTLAWDESRGWWLQDHLEGLGTTSRWDVSTARRVIDAIADLQGLLRDSTPALLAAGAVSLTHELLDAQLQEILGMARNSEGFPAQELSEAFGVTRSVLEDADHTWNHNDLAPQNIGIASPQIAVIDHEVAAVGPGFLTIPRLAETCRKATATPADWFSICEARIAPRLGGAHSDHAHRKAWVTAAAVALLVIQRLHMRRYEGSGLNATGLDRLILHTAGQMVRRLAPT